VSSLTLVGIAANGETTATVELDVESSEGSFTTTKAICAVEGDFVTYEVANAFPDIVFFDPPHFKVKANVQRIEGGNFELLELVDKTATMVFPAIRWRKQSQGWSTLTDAFKQPTAELGTGKIQPEPSSNAIAFDHDHDIELFAVVRQWDETQQKLRYFCGAPDKPASLLVVEERRVGKTTTPIAVPLEDPANDPPEPLNGTVNWFNVEPTFVDRTNNLQKTPPEWFPLDYQDIPRDSGPWKISVGGNAKKGVNRYKVTYGAAESPGATFRQKTIEDHGINDLVMRVIIKGDYANDFFKWASTYINVPFVDGCHPRQIKNYIGIDCAKTVLKAWTLAHPTFLPENVWLDIDADTLLDLPGQGKAKWVLRRTKIYPKGDTDPLHKKWIDIARPQPGDIIVWDWPYQFEKDGITIKKIDPKFDHATIYLSSPGSGTKLTLDGMDSTIFAGSSSFHYRVKEGTYNELIQTVDRMGTPPAYPLPVRIGIIRLIP